MQTSPPNRMVSNRPAYPAAPSTSGKRTSDGLLKLPAPEAAANRLVGFLITTAEDKLDVSRVKALSSKVPAFMATSTGNMERLCLRHCLKGWACGFGASCKFAHPTSITSIDRPTRDTLTNWVNLTDGISFLQGQAPTGTP